MKKVDTAQKGKIKVPKMFFNVKMQQERCSGCNYKLNCRKQQK